MGDPDFVSAMSHSGAVPPKSPDHYATQRLGCQKLYERFNRLRELALSIDLDTLPTTTGSPDEDKPTVEDVEDCTLASDVLKCMNKYSRKIYDYKNAVNHRNECGVRADLLRHLQDVEAEIKYAGLYGDGDEVSRLCGERAVLQWQWDDLPELPPVQGLGVALADVDQLHNEVEHYRVKLSEPPTGAKLDWIDLQLMLLQKCIGCSAASVDAEDSALVQSPARIDAHVGAEEVAVDQVPLAPTAPGST